MADREMKNRAVRALSKGGELVEVGKCFVMRMEYHCPLGEGDEHYVDCYFENGEIVRIFRPDEVRFGEEIDG